ncbi:FliH/SctL family protein [Hydrogenophaga soli]
MTHSSKSAYSRFIPSEEIDAVSTWRFANVDGTPHPDEVKALEPQGPTPEEIEAMVEAARAQGLEQGYAEGHAAGVAETRANLESPLAEAKADWLQRFDSLLTTLDQQISNTHEAMAQSVLEMACELARQVLRQELSTDSTSLVPVVQEALGQLTGDAKPVSIRLHPDDLASIESVWDAAPPAERPTLVPDPSITPGGCLMQAPGSGIDATLEKRWLRTIANLGQSTPWEPDHEDR